MEQWYSVTGKDFTRNHGATVLDYYRGSPCEMLRSLFPQYDWCEWRFTREPVGFWNNRGNRRSYMRWLGEQLGFRKPEDWYRVTYRDFQLHSGNKLLARRSIATAVADAALRQAIERRRPEGKRLMHHSDRGCQYTSEAYQQTQQTMSITCSMSRTGCSFSTSSQTLLPGVETRSEPSRVGIAHHGNLFADLDRPTGQHGNRHVQVRRFFAPAATDHARFWWHRGFVR